MEGDAENDEPHGSSTTFVAASSRTKKGTQTIVLCDAVDSCDCKIVMKRNTCGKRHSMSYVVVVRLSNKPLSGELDFC